MGHFLNLLRNNRVYTKWKINAANNKWNWCFVKIKYEILEIWYFFYQIQLFVQNIWCGHFCKCVIEK